MPNLRDPQIAAQRMLLRGPAFAPNDRIRSAEMEHFDAWEALVDARLIGTAEPLSEEALAAIAANEVALGLRPRKRGSGDENTSLV